MPSPPWSTITSPPPSRLSRYDEPAGAPADRAHHCLGPITGAAPPGSPRPVSSSEPFHWLLLSAVSTTRDPDRLVLFTDAVVAIAVTLLILPLVDLVPDARAEGLTPVEVITEHWTEIFSFLLSFVVIANFWLGHHRVFEHVRAYTPAMMRLNLLWLLVIVVLPFPTEIVGTYESDQFTAGLYTGTILVLSICQTALTWMIHGHAELEKPDDPVSRPELISSLVVTGLTLVAFLLAAFVPGVNFYALLLLLLGPIVSRFVNRRQSPDRSRV